MFLPPLLCDDQFSQPYAILMSHVAADFAFQLQGLLLGRFRELPLKRVFLSTIPPLFSQAVMTFALGQRSPLSSLIQGHRMSLMLLASWTIRLDFLGNIHAIHDQLCIEKLPPFLYFFTPFDKAQAD